MELFLIRHGQSLNNARPRGQRIEDPPLTELGRQQAELAAARLATLKLDRLFTSPFLRTLQTTAPIAQAAQLRPEVRRELHELGGCVSGPELQVMQGQPGMSRSQISKQFPGFEISQEITEHGWWRSQPYESIDAAQKRAARLLTRTQAEFGYSDQRVVYVMHADIKLLLLEHFHRDPLEAPRNGAISRIIITPSQARLVDYNRTDHLPEDLITGGG